MLITFRSQAAGSITMFGDVAKRLLVMMGQSGVSPGAILAPAVPAALACLKKAVAEGQARGGARPAPEEETKDDSAREDGPAIGIGTRAVPLIHLLEEAAAAKADVTWGA